ncbi:MAG: hypothetical protein AAF533_23195 [Acidobacteriota bacterium]
MIHVRVAGRSYELSERKLGVSASMNDKELKARIARHLDLARGELADHFVDRTPTGNLVLRPEAVYG